MAHKLDRTPPLPRKNFRSLPVYDVADDDKTREFDSFEMEPLNTDR